MARKTIAQAPAGEKTSLDGTEKFPISGSQYSLLSTVLAYIRTAVATLTNKTINLANNTVTGTTAEFNTALSDGNFATIAGSEVLTNKTLTAPTIADFTNMAHDHQDADDGGTLAEAALALTDITTNNASAAKHGFLPKLSGDSTLFLNGDGEWTAPTISGAVSDSDILFTDITTNNSTTTQHGFLPKLSGDSDQFLNGDGEWITPTVAGSVATDAIWDAAGDLAVGTGANTAARLAAGTTGHVLTADSAEASGVKWAAGGAGTFTDYSATSTVSGWAATPTVSVFVFKIGRLVTVSFHITGTSNATTASFTVPDAVNATFTILVPCAVTDNGASQAAAGRIRTATSSATINLDKALNASGGWTSSGTKTISGSFSYFTD